MKYCSLLPTLLIVGLNQVLQGQICDFSDDYSDPAPWTFEYVYPGAGGCGDDPQTGTLSVTGGVVYYDSINDANDTRIWRDIGAPVSDESWTAEFEFTPIAIGMAGVPRVGHVIWALTSGTNAPFNDTFEHCIPNDQDGIMVWYLSEYTPSDPTTGFYIYAKNELVYVNTAAGDNITALPGQTYYLRFSRMSSGYVSLQVYLDPARTDLLGEINCFEIPDNITNLHYLQHGNAPWGYYMRVLTGTLDNTCIMNNVAGGISFTGPTTICPGELAEYTVTGADVTDWNLPAEVTYTVIDASTIVVDDWGGLTSATISATVPGICAPITFELEVSILTSVAVDSTIVMCENDTINVFGDIITSPGIYTYTISNPTGCDSIYTVTVEETSIFYSEETYTICEGDSIFIFDAFVSTAGTYTVTITTAGGCDSVVTIIIITEPAPIVYFTEDTIYCPLGGITLTPIITGTYTNILWTPNISLSCTDCEQPFVIALEDGYYYVTVTAASGCSTTDSIFVLVDFTDWGVPNAFSPNSDGINDVFKPILPADCAVDEFVIYNRWGQEIYRTNALNTGWDGTFNGTQQEIGVYVYILNASCESYSIKTSGSVTLIR